MLSFGVLAVGTETQYVCMEGEHNTTRLAAQNIELDGVPRMCRIFQVHTRVGGVPIFDENTTDHRTYNKHLLSSMHLVSSNV